MIQFKFFERSDFEQLINWIDSPEFLLQWSGPQFQFPLTEQQLEKYMENANKENSVTLIYKVILQETGDVIGYFTK